MSDPEVIETVTRLFHAKERLKNLPADADFFDVGVSSLTVVELQISIESALQVQADTSELMSNPSLAGWIRIYANKRQAASGACAVVA